MRLAIFSDIHGNLPALDAVLTDIERQAFDGIWLVSGISSGTERLRTTSPNGSGGTASRR